ncbi:MAG TPA: hypothetical protein PLD25_28145 [Chloroflexota bacterium]|nr:hypothetical protein [Chloroflexota bacterium]HUM68215.1 hypothetical protein [Chloroflexota bacterium]
MFNHARWSVFVHILMVLVGLLWPVAGVWAHGGGVLQIANTPVGTCLASVWLAPSTPRANKTLHVTVGLADAASGVAVLDGTVLVAITDVASGQRVAAAPATTAQSVNRLFYEADLPSLTVGEYLFTLTTTCQGATDELTFVAEIRPSTNPLFIALPLLVGGLLVGIWLYRQWQGQGGGRQPVRKGVKRDM